MEEPNEAKGRSESNALSIEDAETKTTNRDLLLLELSRRVHDIHVALDRPGKTNEVAWKSSVLELLKVALTGWPTFAILFLVLFYTPIRDALTSIPEKVRSADEIQMAGVSLKTAVKQEATRIGEIALSEKLPKLSARALEFLLGLPRDGDQLWAFSPDSNNDFKALWIADETYLKSLDELDSIGLITLEVQIDPSKRGRENWRKVNSSEARQLLKDIPTKYPGKVIDGPLDRTGFEPNTPISRRSLSTIKCELSQLGNQARDVILRAVAKQLSGDVTPKKSN